jgi:hypothetical protein
LQQPDYVTGVGKKRLVQGGALAAGLRYVAIRRG